MSHVAACRLLGVEDSVYDKGGVDWVEVKRRREKTVMDMSGIYADDFVEASVLKRSAEEEFDRKMKSFVDNQNFTYNFREILFHVPCFKRQFNNERAQTYRRRLP